MLNYIHSMGGWRGAKIEWNPQEPVSGEAGYDEEMRRQAEGEADETIQRLKSLIAETLEDFAISIDGSSDSDSDGGQWEGVWRDVD
jgi:helicase MOV-10